MSLKLLLKGMSWFQNRINAFVVKSEAKNEKDNEKVDELLEEIAERAAEIKKAKAISNNINKLTEE